MSYDPQKGDELTPREEEVYAYVGAGYCQNEIAGFLGCSRPTVSNFLGSILQKIGVRTQVELALTYHDIRFHEDRALLAGERAHKRNQERSNGR